MAKRTYELVTALRNSREWFITLRLDDDTGREVRLTLPAYIPVEIDADSAFHSTVTLDEALVEAALGRHTETTDDATPGTPPTPSPLPDMSQTTTNTSVVPFTSTRRGVWQVTSSCPKCGGSLHAEGEAIDGEPVPNPPLITCPMCGQGYTLALFYR